MRKSPWISLAFDTWSLGLEASTVIGLRLSKMAMLDASAMAEAQLMVAEKLEAASQLQVKALTGSLGHTPQSSSRKSIAHYRKAVRKNRHRLTRERV